jgi:hypothetical protein
MTRYRFLSYCHCGHPSGDHHGSRTYGLNAPQYGACRYCECEAFADDAHQQTTHAVRDSLIACPDKETRS